MLVMVLLSIFSIGHLAEILVNLSLVAGDPPLFEKLKSMSASKMIGRSQKIVEKGGMYIRSEPEKIVK
jgi:hypothetical protein